MFDCWYREGLKLLVDFVWLQKIYSHKRKYAVFVKKIYVFWLSPYSAYHSFQTNVICMLNVSFFLPLLQTNNIILVWVKEKKVKRKGKSVQKYYICYANINLLITLSKPFFHWLEKPIRPWLCVYEGIAILFIKI